MVCRSKKKEKSSAQLPRRQPKKKPRPLNTQRVTAESEPATEETAADLEYLPLHAIGDHSPSSIQVPLLINNKSHSMELDTGTAVSIISEGTCKELFATVALRESPIVLKIYTGEQLPVIGEFDAQVQYETQTQTCH